MDMNLFVAVAPFDGYIKPDVATPDWYPRFFASVYRFSRKGCWIWTGPFDACGYGMFSYDRKSSTGGRTAAVRAHRFCLEQYQGIKIPNDMVVLHRCDTPQCVNPVHLLVGTIDDNMADRNSKGRQARGEKNAIAKLTTQQVLEIRASDLRPMDLAAIYGVSPGLISNIRARRIWRHI